MEEIDDVFNLKTDLINDNNGSIKNNKFFAEGNYKK